MGFTNKYPYTDFHELNLDAFIARIQSLENKVATLETRVPKAPTDAGTYTLQCTVDADGNQTYEWG